VSVHEADEFVAEPGARAQPVRAGLLPGKAKVAVKGGTHGVPALPFVADRVLVQLRTTSGQCWVASFTTASKNDATQYRAKSD